MSMYIMKPWYKTSRSVQTTTFATTTFQLLLTAYNRSSIFVNKYKSIGYAGSYGWYKITAPKLRISDINSLYNLWSENQTTFNFKQSPYSTYTGKAISGSVTHTVTGVGISSSAVNTDYGNICYSCYNSSSSSRVDQLFAPNDRATSNNVIRSMISKSNTARLTFGYCDLTDPFKVTLVSLSYYGNFTRNSSSGTSFRATLTELPA